MWTAAPAAAMTSPGIAEARVEAGEAVVGCLLGSPAYKERSAESKSVEESEIYQEEIRTLMRSQTAESLELEDSDSRSSCFTGPLGLVSPLHGITRPRGDRAPILTTTPSILTSLLYSTPDPVFLHADDAAFVAAEAAVVEGKPGHGSLACAVGSNAVVQPAASEQEAVCEQSQKRCAKRKEPEKKKKSKGKSGSGSAGKKGKAGAVGRCQASDDKDTAAASAAAVGDDDVKSCEFEEVEANKEKVKLPYVHVRARRGQATDRHSLAERARREKINARMKLLQDLVPGCNKVSGTALVLEEIINHVQTLQRQVEILSMRLAAVNPSFDLSALDGFLDAADALAMMDLPNEAWGFQVPAMLSQQEGWLWQHLLQQQHQVEGDAMIAPQHPQHQQEQQQQLLQVASTSEWARPGDVHRHHLLHRHGSLRYESSNPVPLPPNRVKAEL